MVFDNWVGVFVPAGTPAAIVERLNGEIGKVSLIPPSARNFSKPTRSRSVAAARNSPGLYMMSTKNTDGWRRS